MPFFASSLSLAGNSFKTPSNNIACAVYEKVLRCDLKENLAKIPPRPKDCELDWGHFFTMGSKGPSMRACAGDTIWGVNDPVLDYGKIWEKEGFRCQSEATGLTCINTDQHGWILKKTEQKIF
ncbi:MAG: hypothetical protein JNK65_00990 [Deltaproteobacteria bacterium]|nr:hypothetical protein [Deltaproteobacteria bacterium]